MTFQLSSGQYWLQHAQGIEQRQLHTKLHILMKNIPARKLESKQWHVDEFIHVLEGEFTIANQKSSINQSLLSESQTEYCVYGLNCTNGHHKAHCLTHSSFCSSCDTKRVAKDL